MTSKNVESLDAARIERKILVSEGEANDISWFICEVRKLLAEGELEEAQNIVSIHAAQMYTDLGHNLQELKGLLSGMTVEPRKEPMSMTPMSNDDLHTAFMLLATVVLDLAKEHEGMSAGAVANHSKRFTELMEKAGRLASASGVALTPPDVEIDS